MRNREERDLRFAIYSRKSRITGRGESIENQAELCREYIFSQYPGAGEEAISLYEDEGFSGGNINRPRFRIMMQDAEKGRFSVIVCYRLDRISRNIGDFARLIEELNRLGVAFVSIREQFDTQSPLGRAMMYIASVFSQLERETIAERIRDNMLELAKSGRWLGGVTPTGYASETEERVSSGGGKKKSCRLRTVPEEAERVRLIFEEYRRTGSLTRVETRLLGDGVRTKNGKRYTRFTIRKILENPVYMIADNASREFFSGQGAEVCGEPKDFDGKRGVMAYNKTLQRPGKANRVRDMKEWIIAAGGHRGIVSGEEWISVQEMLGRGQEKAYRRPKNHRAVLSGLLYCGLCGSCLRPKTDGKGKNTGGGFHYLCTMKEKSRGEICKIKNPPGDRLDAEVLRTLFYVPAELKTLSESLDACRERLSDAEAETRQALLRRNLKSNRREIQSLVSVLGRAGETPAKGYLTEAIGRLHEENQALEQAIGCLEKEEGNRIFSPAELEASLEALLLPETILSRAEIEEQKNALRTLVRRAVWDGERCHLYFIGAKLPDTEAKEIEAEACLD